jgi:hypothetical protein
MARPTIDDATNDATHSAIELFEKVMRLPGNPIIAWETLHALYAVACFDAVEVEERTLTFWGADGATRRSSRGIDAQLRRRAAGQSLMAVA